jgi:hypothetical protein
MLSKEFLPEAHLTNPKEQPKPASAKVPSAKKRVEDLIKGVVPKSK